MIPELRNFCYERRLQYLELIFLEQKRLQGQLIETYKCLNSFNDVTPEGLFERDAYFPTYSLTYSPSYSPTYSPAHFPTYSLTYSPSYSPTYSQKYSPNYFSVRHCGLSSIHSPTYSPRLLLIQPPELLPLFPKSPPRADPHSSGMSPGLHNRISFD
ncbi:hypothetical protein FHG87_023613 [Trinorchestia longiramus]|nr:hypothetical protein FHG87_023613 [Trinorchestia longiramus]